MSQPYPPPPSGQPLPTNVNSTKILCGIMGILLGGLGVHRFILGDVGGGIIRILITIVTCGLGSIVGLIEGIIYLTKTDQEFYSVYMIGKKSWF